MEHPVDDNATQLLGRMMLVEIILTMLLAERRDYQGVLDNLDRVLSGVEAHMFATEPGNRDRLTAMFEAARIAGDAMAAQIRHIRGDT